MAAGRLVVPNYMPALDLNGAPVAGAKLYFYENETTILKNTFTTAALNVANANPVVANAAGVFPSIFADEDEEFSVAIVGPDDEPIVGLRNRDNLKPTLFYGDDVVAEAETARDEAVAATAGKANVALETNATLKQFGTGSVNVSVGDDFSHYVRPSQYMASGETDYGLGFNRARAAIVTRGYGEIFLDNGSHTFTTPLTIDRTGQTGSNPLTHISVIGPGSASCELRWAGADGVQAMAITGGVWGGGTDTRIKVRGFTLRGLDGRPVTNRLGLKLERTNFVEVDDVYLLEFFEAMRGIDIVGARITDTNISFNSRGIVADGGLDPLAGSAPNEWTFTRCHFGNNRELAARMTGVTNLLVLNGSVEGNGLSIGGLGNNATAVGFHLIDPCFNGATACKFISTHFEYNIGRADVLIEHDQNPAVYSFDGIDFFRVDDNISVTSHIEIDTTGATPYQVNMANIGIGFNIYGSPIYSPAANDIILRTGTPNARDEVNAWGLNIQTGMTRPAFTNEVFRTVTPTLTPASGAFGATPTQDIGIKRDGRNVTVEGTITVANNGTGGGSVVVSGLGVVAKRNIICGLGRNNATGATLQVLALAGTQNLQITTSAGGYPVSSGQEITFHAEYEAT